MVKQIPKAQFPAALIHEPGGGEVLVDPQRRITANWHRWTVMVDQSVRRMAKWFTFLELEDTPDSYAGQTLKLVRVNAGETGLEFVSPATSAPVAAEYVTLATDATLTNERVLTAGAGITITDGGAGNPVTVASTITQYTDEKAQDAIAALLVAGANITLTYNDGANTLTIDASGGSYTDEQAQDAAAALIQNGTGISWSYNDGANTLTPTVSLAAFSTTNLSEGSNLYFTDERAQDAVAAALVAGSNITITYNDGANTITIAAAGGTAASTTEVLTGTDTAKFATPDAVASLWEQGSNVASASTTTLGEGGYFHITGTTTITAIAFATDHSGRCARVCFDGALTLTHNATSLILPTAANVSVAAGDRAIFVSEGSGNIRCIAYTRADGTPLALSNSGVTAATYGDASHVPQFAVDAKGRVTGVTNVAISGAAVSPFTFVQEGYAGSLSNGTSFTITFPQAAAASGNTLWMICACDGSSTVTVPTGWTADINQQQGTYARLIVCHKTSASDTSATWTVASASSFAIAFFELSGARTLDVSSGAGAANTAIVFPPAITPTAGSMVFCAACEVAGGGGPLPQGSSLSPIWNNFTILGGTGNGQRMLFGHIYAYQGAGASITPPPINNNGQGLFASGGIAYASFSIR